MYSLLILDSIIRHHLGHLFSKSLGNISLVVGHITPFIHLGHLGHLGMKKSFRTFRTFRTFMQGEQFGEKEKTMKCEFSDGTCELINGECVEKICDKEAVYVTTRDIVLLYMCEEHGKRFLPYIKKIERIPVW